MVIEYSNGATPSTAGTMKKPRRSLGGLGGRSAAKKQPGFFGRLMNRARRALGGGNKGGSGGASV